MFKKGNSYIYVGKAKKFGGKSGRYTYGYRYLVDSLLKTGAELWVLRLNPRQWDRIRDFENTVLDSARAERAVNRQRIQNFRKIEWLLGP